MSDDDRYTRITLRIPKELTLKLKDAADARSHSMNAEIIQRLENTFGSDWDKLHEFIKNPSNTEGLTDDEREIAWNIRYMSSNESDRLERSEKNAYLTISAIQEIRKLKKSGDISVLLDSLNKEEQLREENRKKWLSRHPVKSEKIAGIESEYEEWENKIKEIRREQEELYSKLKEARAKSRTTKLKLKAHNLEITRDMMRERLESLEKEEGIGEGE
ncbi:Arc family DNA-binding protein [Acetobacter sp. DsW_063]|uniref:Arc family DNA-binding protein n=1 Tax=Acetobacter sp. DsW_063 TaxID=1514894 RepID=UPI000A3B8B45|nr:Arc family DNA-binding protein [Acetobacter sp. DsW_063]